MSKLVATFHDPDSAERAVDALKRAGFNEQDISLVTRDHRAHTAEHEGQTRDGVEDGTAWGAGIGAGATLLASAGLLVIPGIGPLLALGPLAAGLTGAAAGGLVGAFVDWGIPAGESEHLEKEIKEGRAVVLVDAKDKASKAKQILQEHHAVEVREPA
jgi:uncharacterized membrane protein